MNTFVDVETLTREDRDLLATVRELQGERRYQKMLEMLLRVQNHKYDPNKLAHYCNTRELDRVIMGELESTVALCGHVFRASDRGFAGVDSYAEARKPGRKTCPVCSEIYQGLPR